MIAASTRTLRRIALPVVALLLATTGSPAYAADAGVIGRWKTFSDRTGKPESIVRLAEVEGEIRGTIETIFPEPHENPDPKCDKCPDAFRGKPVRGLEFMWGFRRDGQGYGTGRILDPEEGAIYHCRIELADGGRTLRVRGYVGVPLFGRTQTWQRVEP